MHVNQKLVKLEDNQIVFPKEVKFEQADDGFALYVTKEKYFFSIEINTETFFESGGYNINYDEKDKEYLKEIEDYSIKLLSSLIDVFKELEQLGEFDNLKES